MSDGYDGSGQVPRRSPRVNEHTPPVSGVLAIVLAAIAVVAGFFILRSITDGGDDTALGGIVDVGDVADSAGAADTTVPIDPSQTTVAVPVVTEPPFVVTGASVVVANANGQGGSAGRFGSVLASAAGFTIADPPVNATASSGGLETSAIFYSSTNPAALPVANSLNQVLGGAIAVSPMPADGPPTLDGELSGADVLLMLGTDFAAATAADLVLPLAGGGTTATATTLAPVSAVTTAP
jgi:hypothetical protein